MRPAPLLSFIVLSYNYADYISRTIASILAQTVQDFEIVVVDDASTDHSCDVVRAFADARIQLLVNDHNQGGAASYNRAVLAARGRYLVNLDADDWILPTKAERQLAAMTRDQVDILGSHVRIVGADGQPHPEAPLRESLINQPHDLNRAAAWIGCNNLVRSSTMIDRLAHLRIGLDDPTMVRAPDYELWTRALANGLRFGILPEPLTCYRLHAGGVTFGDPQATFLELAYAMHRNLVPMLERQGCGTGPSQIFAWMTDHAEFARLALPGRHMLAGVFLSALHFPDFAGFRDRIMAGNAGDPVATIGQRAFAMTNAPNLRAQLAQCQTESADLIKARDFWQQTSIAYAEARDFWHQTSAAYAEARDFWHQTSTKLGEARDCWQARSATLERQIDDMQRHWLRWGMRRLRHRMARPFR